MDDTLTTLAGGAIGTLMLGIAWAVGRLWAVPGDVQRHDAQTRVLNQDLELWVSDDFRRLRQELDGITNAHAGRGLLYSGFHGAARSEAKTRYLHGYRDRLHEAERRLAVLQSQEYWAHGLWRMIRPGVGPLRLTAPGRVERVLEEVRKPTTRHGASASVHDPMDIDLEELLRELEREPLEPALPPTLETVTDELGDEKQRPIETNAPSDPE